MGLGLPRAVEEKCGMTIYRDSHDKDYPQLRMAGIESGTLLLSPRLESASDMK
jgi:hypothetical protein